MREDRGDDGVGGDALHLGLRAELDAVAVTRGPGLVGSLLVGVQAAKSIAFVHGKPLVPVHCRLHRPRNRRPRKHRKKQQQ